MSSRRQFLKIVPATALGAMFLDACKRGKKPAAAPGSQPRAGDDTASDEEEAGVDFAMMPSNIIYSSGNQGKWEGKAGSHVPVVTVDKDSGMVSVETKHGMKPKHYIVRHTLVAPNGDVIHAHTFGIKDSKAVSSTEAGDKLSGLTKAYAFSYCNLHDLWVAEVSI